jgi:hypothetical protein
MNFVAPGASGTINLQATLSSSSAGSALEGETPPSPHHPITCTSTLWYAEDGAFGCEHVRVPPNDTRTKFCIDHSIALLLIELAVKQL